MITKSSLIEAIDKSGGDRTEWAEFLGITLPKLETWRPLESDEGEVGLRVRIMTHVEMAKHSVTDYCDFEEQGIGGQIMWIAADDDTDFTLIDHVPDDWEFIDEADMHRDGWWFDYHVLMVEV